MTTSSKTSGSCPFLKFLEDISPFCGGTDTTVLDFWWRRLHSLPWPWWAALFLLVANMAAKPLSSTYLRAFVLINIPNGVNVSKLKLFESACVSLFKRSYRFEQLIGYIAMMAHFLYIHQTGKLHPLCKGSSTTAAWKSNWARGNIQRWILGINCMQGRNKWGIHPGLQTQGGKQQKVHDKGVSSGPHNKKLVNSIFSKNR